jgi:tRNA modification GTPase
MTMFSTDTIVAPATPPGEGGVGIIRVSGPLSAQLLAETFVGCPTDRMRSHQLYHGQLRAADGSQVDEVLAVIMRTPHSYTGEDVVEVHCHGGPQIMRQALDLFLSKGGRLANPGEFTQRAFLNGRLDLSQAEAVINVIRARSAEACQVALGQLNGRLSQRVHRFANHTRTALALIEAHIDFPDDEVGSLDLTAVQREVAATVEDMTRLLDTFDTGRILRDGINLLILGRPNVGKSSLMNAMLGEARAIVTEIPGTTRDTLEESMVLGGFPIRLIDTAGVRDTDNLIEQEGVRRAKDKVGMADLVLLVLDASEPLKEEDRLAASLCAPEKTLLVLNKVDRPNILEDQPLEGFLRHVSVSAKLEQGLEALFEAVVTHFDRRVVAGDRREDVVLSERRHQEAVLRARHSLMRFLESAQHAAPLECLSIELREALAALGQITGETTPDDILEQIFSEFCVGK